ncbi:hypothetical protein SAMN06265338_1081, partial [Rhodoblastus acidophilus]
MTRGDPAVFQHQGVIAALKRQQAKHAGAALKLIRFQHFSVLTVDPCRLGRRVGCASWGGAGWVFCSRAVGGARFCVGALRLVLSALIRA